ncbi:hypothetical protein [Yersinia hibernica]|uniref:Uncharacterized protein n=1 Tax=Yersinia enterocolitica LC20 TaxID=1443113 RepID=A0A7U4GDR6_YEREN|nr:hypothetical protein [Yersinia hibernica]AHM72605.2 hypothetical protein LC20_01351 [Yersinia hibernica]OVZ83022.1 hypothetical protein CBW54_16610 [Yersinia kristensenii]
MRVISSVTSNAQVIINNDDQNDDFDSNEITLEKIKLDIMTAFIGIKYDVNSKINALIGRNTNITTLEDIVISVNKYLEKSKGTDRCNMFISNIEKEQDSELNKNYKLDKSSNGLYKFIDRKDAVESTSSSCLNEINRGKETKIKEHHINKLKAEGDRKVIVNKTKEAIKNANEEFIALEDLHRVTYALVSMYNTEFSKTEKVADVGKLKNIIPEGVVLNNDELNEFKLQLERLNNKNRAYIEAINSNLDLLPSTFDKLNHLENKIIPDVSKIINPAIVELCYPQENFWTWLANAISAFLFPKISKEKQDKKKQLENNLSELNGLITELSKKPGYHHVMEAPWLYELVSHLLIKGIPAQYPFDPLNVLSPDRKVWLELQKEWLKPLESKSDEPKLSS